jgi:hypothetical protein
MFMKGRKAAQSQLLLISDGAMSFKFETKNAARAIKDQGVHLNAVVIRGSITDDETEDMQKLVSQPWETHM